MGGGCCSLQAAALQSGWYDDGWSEPGNVCSDDCALAGVWCGIAVNECASGGPLRRIRTHYDGEAGTPAWWSQTKAEGHNVFIFRVLAQWWDGSWSLVVAPQVLLIVEAADGCLAGQGKQVCSCRGVVGKAEQMCSSRGTSCTQSPSRLIICISMHLIHMQNTSCDFKSLTKLTLCRRRRHSCSPASC